MLTAEYPTVCVGAFLESPYGITNPVLFLYIASIHLGTNYLCIVQRQTEKKLSAQCVNLQGTLPTERNSRDSWLSRGKKPCCWRTGENIPSVMPLGMMTTPSSEGDVRGTNESTAKRHGEERGGRYGFDMVHYNTHWLLFVGCFHLTLRPICPGLRCSKWGKTNVAVTAAH